MANISAALVKELREKTGAGMMDCKKALGETDGDIEAAIDWLRTKGLAKAAKKAGRVAAEGLVGIAISGSEAAVVEVNSETDFVARNEQFQNFVSATAQTALGTDGTLEALQAAKLASGSSVEDTIKELIATIGENMTLRRVEKVSVKDGVVAAYMHNAVAEGLGKIGVLVALESDASDEVLQGLGKQLAMHIAAAFPKALNEEDLDEAEI